MSLYEIEIKSLLGDEKKVNNFKTKLSNRGVKFLTRNKQLNHYFVVTDVGKFRTGLEAYISADKKKLFKKILEEGDNFSIRTRDTDGEVQLVIKASIGGDSSENGVSRMEFEDVIDLSLDKLDKKLLDAGLRYQAKWSREREEYKLDGVNICLDKNAGYGHLAEFEKIVPQRSMAESARAELLKVMRSFDLDELPQDRLERMFAHYNDNWRSYYGTDKVFFIE